MDGVVWHKLKWRSDRKVVCGKADQFTFEFVIGSQNFPCAQRLRVAFSFGVRIICSDIFIHNNFTKPLAKCQLFM